MDAQSIPEGKTYRGCMLNHDTVSNTSLTVEQKLSSLACADSVTGGSSKNHQKDTLRDRRAPVYSGP